MTIFSFLHIAPVQLILMSFLCGFAVLIHSFTGRLLVKGHGFFTSAITALAFHAAVVTVLICFATSFAKFYIFGVLVLAVLLGLAALCKAVFVTKNFRAVLKSLWPAWGVLALAFFALNCLLTLIYLHDLNQGGEGVLLFNAHQNYFSAISLELFKADYLGRIRIFDNYPVLWSKYHFFNGSLIAQPLAILMPKNLLSFMIAKIAIISLMAIVVIENCRYRDKLAKFLFTTAVALAFMFTVLAHQTLWAIFTNSFTSIFFLIMALLFLERRQLPVALFYILCFSLSTSRSLIPGAALIAALAVEYFNHFRNSNPDCRTPIITSIKQLLRQCPKGLIIAIVVFAAAILAMVLTGQSVRTPLHYNPKNFLYKDWIALMSPALMPSDVAAGASEGSILKPSFTWYLFWLASVVWMLIPREHYPAVREKIIQVIRPSGEAPRKYLPAFLVVTGLLLFILSHDVKILTFYFVIPVTLALWLSPQNIRKYVAVFCAASLVQVLFLYADIAIPNYAAVEWIVLFGFLLALFNRDFTQAKPEMAFVACFLLLYLVEDLPLNPTNLFALDRSDRATREIPLNAMYQTRISSPHASVLCYADDNTASLAALAGIRVFYSAATSELYSASKNFTMPTPQDLSTIKALCPPS